MGNRFNIKRVALAGLAVALLTGGALAAHAATFGDRYVANGTDSPSFPSVAPTSCTADPCELWLHAGPGVALVKDVSLARSAADGAVTAASATLTSATMAFTSADEGRMITVAGAGTLGADLQTTIAVVTNATTVQLAAQAQTTVSGSAVAITGTSVPFLGFNVSTTSTPGDHTLAGGPTSTIKVRQGTTLKIHFSQDPSISNHIVLSFPSLPVTSVSEENDTYTVNASQIGTSVFQPGSNDDAPKQIAQGLVGVLIVTPANCDNCAFDGTHYADEAIVATTDLDLDFARNPAAFDMGYFGQSPNPDGSQRKVYHLINGKSFPDTDVIDVRAGETLLMRSVNAGVTDKSMGLLGLRETLLGRNASAYKEPQTFVAPLIGPGETADIAVSVPATTQVGTRFALMDEGRQMNHGTTNGFGGALTFIDVWPPAGLSVDQTSFDIATQALTATGHPSDSNAIVAYETVVTSGVAPTASEWAAAVSQPLSGGAAGAPLTFTTPTIPAATGGSTVWVRVQQNDAGHSWSAPAKTVVVSTSVTVDSATLNGAVLTATASALPPGVTVNGLFYSLNDNTFPAGGTSFYAGLPGNPITAGSTVAGTLVDGDSVFVRATSPQVSGYSNVATATVVGPQVTSASFTGPDQLTINATSATSTIAAAEYSIGASAAAPGAGTNIVDTFGAASYSGTVSITPQPLAGQLVWARVQDAAGVWSKATSLTVAGPTVDTLTFTAPDQLQIAASSATANVAAAEYSVGAAAAAPGAGTSVGGVFGNPTYAFTATMSPAPTAGQTVWMRVQDSNGTWSQPKSVAAIYPKPVVDATTAFAAPDQLTIDAHAVIGDVSAAEISIGASAAAAGSGKSVGTTFGSPTYSETVTVVPQPSTNDTIWVRVQDSYGTWSDAVSVTA